MTKTNRISIAVLGGVLLLAGLSAAAYSDLWPATYVGSPSPKMSGVPDVVRHTLANFDDLDFRVYTGQQWQDVHLSHSQDVIVHWPDGTRRRGSPGTSRTCSTSSPSHPTTGSSSTRSGLEPT